MKTELQKGTKVKFGQVGILIVIIAIEIIGFSRQLHAWIPSIENFLDNNSTILKIIVNVLIIIAVVYLHNRLSKNKSEPLFIVFLVKGFQIKGSDFVGIFNIVFTLCSISWIGIELYSHSWGGLLNAFIYAGFMILYPLIIANYVLPKPIDKEIYEPKVLITALSKMRSFDKLQEAINQMEAEGLNWNDQVFNNPDGTMKEEYSFPWGPWLNWDPIRKSIIHHKASFQEIIILISNEVVNDIEECPDSLKPDKLISDFISRVYPDLQHNIKIDLRRVGVSGNSLHENLQIIESIVKLLNIRKIEDCDILFNITGGTSTFSGAMILKAIPNERRAEYAQQDNGTIEDVPLNIYDVQDLWSELLEKVG